MSQSSTGLSRRTMFARAGAAGAVAAIASLLPSGSTDATRAEHLPKAPPARGGGYSLSEHVKKYYRTARI